MTEPPRSAAPRFVPLHGALLRYGSALVSVLLATWVRLLLGGMLGVRIPFATFFIAVMFSAWYGGLGPAMLAIILGALAAGYYFIPPENSLTISGLENLVGLALYFIVGIVIALTSEAQRRAARRAEKSAESLRESQRWFLTTLSSIGDAVIATDGRGRVIFINPVAQSLTGWGQQEARGRPLEEVFNIIDEQTRQKVESPVERVLREGRVVGLANHTLLVTKDGAHVPIDDSGAPIRGEDGEITGVVLVFRDITEGRRADEAVQKWEQVFARASWGVVIASPEDDTLQAVNPAYAAMHGYRVEELVGMPLDTTVAPEAREAWREQTRIAHERGHHVYESLHVRKDGSRFPVLMDVTAVKDRQGKILYRAANLQDITARKRAEEAVAFAASIVESSEDAIIGKTLDGTIVSWNRGAEKIYGYSLEEVRGRNVSMLAPPERHDEIPQILELIKRGEPVKHFETFRVTKDGRLIEVALTVSPIKDTQGVITGASTIARDITDRKRSEHERRRLLAEIENQRERLNNVMANIPGVVWEAWGQPDQSRQQIDFVSDYAETMLGYTVQEWLATPNFWLTIVHPDDKPRAAEEAAAIFSGGRGGTSEFRWVAKDGRVIWVEAQSVVVLDEHGNPAGMRGVTMDITPRKRAAESQQFLAEASALLASSLDYETTLASVARLAVPKLSDWCAVHIVEEDGQVRQLAVTHVDPVKVEWAKELERRYPADMSEPVGMPNVLRTGLSEIYTEIPYSMIEAAARDEEHLRIINELGMKSAMVVPLVARGRTLGVITFVSAESGRHFDNQDLALAEDLARRAALAVDNARLYRQANKVRLQAEEANRAKDEFLATVSHELRTPLNAILGWSHMLRTTHFDEATQARAMETIERNAKSQAQLIEDILDVSRIITGKLRLDVRPVELTPIVEAAVEAIRPAADAKEIRLQTILDPRAGPVSGDPGRLQQVVWNLVSNAVKFTPKAGRVQVRLQRVNSHIEVIVSDTGQGISEDFLPHVFDRFRQADSTTTRVHGGLGLGLAIVRHLVEMHGGTVEAESPGEGRGATFTVKLPLAIARAEMKDAERKHPTAATGLPLNHSPDLTGLRVLVVDDDTDARDMLKIMIEQFGAEVRACNSSAEGMRALEQWGPDVLISDIEMPGEDGYELIRKIRALAPERGGRIPAIALTAYARVEDRMRALSAGYHMHVAKPVEPVELGVIIASLAGRRGKDLNL